MNVILTLEFEPQISFYKFAWD